MPGTPTLLFLCVPVFTFHPLPLVFFLRGRRKTGARRQRDGAHGRIRLTASLVLVKAVPFLSHSHFTVMLLWIFRSIIITWYEFLLLVLLFLLFCLSYDFSRNQHHLANDDSVTFSLVDNGIRLSLHMHTRTKGMICLQEYAPPPCAAVFLVFCSYISQFIFFSFMIIWDECIISFCMFQLT